MKKLGYIFLCMVALWGCQDNADYPFKGKDAVYFQLQTDDYYWSETLDSMVYTFAGKGVDEDTLWVRVNLQGDALPYARDILVVTDDEKTTAEEGLHYEALKPVYELPADSVYTQIPVIIYNKDEKLEEKQVTIALALKPSDELDLGITDRRTCRLLVSNMLGKPLYWEGTISWDFGEYSRKKHELCILELGRDFPAEASEYSAESRMWDVYGAYMSNYFEENYPVYDENDRIIEPW